MRDSVLAGVSVGLTIELSNHGARTARRLRGLAAPMIDLEGISASCIRVESTNERRGLQRDSCHGFDVHVAGIEVNFGASGSGLWGRGGLTKANVSA